MKTMTTKRLLLCVMAMLTVCWASATVKTYDFTSLENNTYTASGTTSCDKVNGQNMNLLKLGDETFDDRFAVSRAGTESATSAWVAKNWNDEKGLFTSYNDRYFTILNLKDGDKITVTWTTGGTGTLNFFDAPAISGKSADDEVTSGTTYTISTTSSSVNVNLYAKGNGTDTKIYIKSITIDDGVNDDPTDDPSTPEPSTTGNYTVTINQTTNGTVTSTHAKADQGETVTLTVTPASDSYKLVNLVIEQVTGDEGDTPSLAPRRTLGFVGNVEYTKVNATTYTFTMPANNVEISATFTDNPVARPTITYDEPNNKVTLHLTTDPTGDEADFAVNTKLYYTTDNTDPATSSTRIEATADVQIDVTAEITVIRVVGVSSDGHTSVEVKQEVSLVRYLTVSKEWTAFCSPETFAKPEGLNVYTISAVTKPTNAGEAGSVTLKEQTIIATGVPMIIKNTGYANTTRFRIENTTGSIEAADQCSEFKGSATAASTLNSSNVNYVLKNGSFIRTTATQVSKYGCYLEFASGTSAPSFNIVVDGNMTAIKSLGVATLDEGAWYTLNGLRVAQPTQKGIYIHQGKKVVIK